MDGPETVEFTDDQLRIIFEILMPYMPKEMQWGSPDESSESA